MVDFDTQTFLLRADERSEMLADQALNVIKEALILDGVKGPIPDPYTISIHNFRLMIRTAYKAGAVFGLEEVIKVMRRDHFGQP